MIFSIQRYLEDYFNRRGFSDLDQYSVRIANIYFQNRWKKTDEELLIAFYRIRTVFFANNSSLSRKDFEKSLLKSLDNQYKKKESYPPSVFPGDLKQELKQFKSRPRINIHFLINQFAHAIEARAVNEFWVSRKRGELISRPERIGQALLALFAEGTIAATGKGFIIREMATGIGFVDIALILSSVMHLLELKVLTNIMTGPSQLQEYMKTEQRNEGWLILFDARDRDKRKTVPKVINTEVGTIKTCLININPETPSKTK